LSLSIFLCFYWLYTILFKYRAKLILITVSGPDYFSAVIKNSEGEATQEVLPVHIRLVDGREPLRLEAISPAVIDNDGAGFRFHALCLLLIFETQPGHIRNQLQTKRFLAMVKPLVVDVLVGTSHQRGERVKHPFPHEAIAHTQEGIEVEPDLETLKGVLEGCITVDLLNHFRIGGIALPVEVIQLGLAVVLFSDVVYFAHSDCIYWFTV